MVRGSSRLPRLPAGAFVGALLTLAGCGSLLQTQEEKNAALTDGVMTRQVQRVATALAAGANPNQRTSDGSPLLVPAVSVCDEAIVPALIAAKADPNLGSAPPPNLALAMRSGWSPLMEAASSTFCGAPMVDLLLRAGADPNLRADGGITALMLVARTSVADSKEKALLLLAARAEIDAQDKTGQTALMQASGEGNQALAELLLDRGASVKLKSSEPLSTALMRAAYRGDQAIVGLLVARGAPVDETNDRGETALMLAVQQNDAAMVTRMLQAGANPRLKDKYGKSVSDLATESGSGKALAALNAAKR